MGSYILVVLPPDSIYAHQEDCGKPRITCTKLTVAQCNSPLLFEVKKCVISW